MNLMKIAKERFLPHVAAYGLCLHEDSPTDVIAYSRRVILWLFAGRDGLHVSYIGKHADGNRYEYPLGTFLVTRSKPRSQPASDVPEEYEAIIGAELEWHAIALADCSFILRGEPQWIKEYPWKPSRVVAPRSATLDRLEINKLDE